MSDSATPSIAIAITPMHQGEDGVWETGARAGASLFLVELVQGDGTDAEVVLECRDERSAALAARVAAATAAALGLGGGEAGDAIPAFDDDTASILSAHPTPEIALPAGQWREEEEDDADAEDGPPRPG